MRIKAARDVDRSRARTDRSGFGQAVWRCQLVSFYTMATAASPGDSPSPLDLAFLTEEERTKIERVLAADEALRTKDQIRLG